eukprot:scaffold27864_cov90-Isochrysis_galbana.AAC.3
MTKAGTPPRRLDISAYHFWMRGGPFLAALAAGLRHGISSPHRHVALPATASTSKSRRPQSEQGGGCAAAMDAGRRSSRAQPTAARAILGSGPPTCRASSIIDSQHPPLHPGMFFLSLRRTTPLLPAALAATFCASSSAQRLQQISDRR